MCPLRKPQEESQGTVSSFCLLCSTETVCGFPHRTTATKTHPWEWKHNQIFSVKKFLVLNDKPYKIYFSSFSIWVMFLLTQTTFYTKYSSALFPLEKKKEIKAKIHKPVLTFMSLCYFSMHMILLTLGHTLCIKLFCQRWLRHPL